MKIMNISKPQNELKESLNELDKNSKLDSLEEKISNGEVEKDQEQVSDGDEDDEDLLAACISMGIQNNRYFNILYYIIILVIILFFLFYFELIYIFIILIFLNITDIDNHSKHPQVKNHYSRNHRIFWYAVKERQFQIDWNLQFQSLLLLWTYQ